jgi:EmrB/QacA subfamily drug resistance transporter
MPCYFAVAVPQSYGCAARLRGALRSRATRCGERAIRMPAALEPVSRGASFPMFRPCAEPVMTPSIAAYDPSRQLLPFRESLLAMFGVALVAMLVALDQTIVGTALPRIVADLKGFDLYAWVATSYMLASVITIPIFGRLGDLYGRKPFLLAAILLFTVASVLCGLASSMLLLVLARGLQGIGGGILIGTVFATVADLFPDPRLRLRWLVFVTSAFGVANIVGPTLGGVLTQMASWRFVFFVNVPVGIVSLWFVQRFLPALRHQRKAGPIQLDWLGAFVVAVTLGSLQLLIELLPKEGFNRITITLAVLTTVCGLTLWFWEKRMGYPVVPVDVLMDRKLAALFAMSVLGGFALFSLVFYVPLLFQGGYAMSPHDSGLLITPLLLGTTVGSVLNNRIVTRIRRANAIMYIGFALFALACLCVVALNGHEPHLVWMSCMGLSGLGLGMVATNLTICSQQLVERDHLGAVTALMQSLRIFGGMLGTAITGAVLGHLYSEGVHRSLDSYQASQWLKSFASPDLLVDRAEQAALVERLVNAGHSGDMMMNMARHALIESIHVGLTVAVAAALIGLCLAWFVPVVRVTYPELAARSE